MPASEMAVAAPSPEKAAAAASPLNSTRSVLSITAPDVPPIGSSRGRPGSSNASNRGTGRDGEVLLHPASLRPEQDIPEETLGDAEAEEAGVVVRVATTTLLDRSTYHGEVNTDGQPDGMGVLLSIFGSTYAGAMQTGKKHGVGVELHANGSSFCGEFRDGLPNGYGVHIGAFGDTYLGEWDAGARHGVGVCIDADAAMTVKRFCEDEPVVESGDSEVTELSWEDDVQPHVLRAALAEKAALRSQEAARQRHLDAELQSLTTVDSKPLATPEAVSAFEATEQLELATFIRDQSQKRSEANAAAGEAKFAEARLMQRQKELRADISARRRELTCVAKYCALAETRAAQVREAERTLAALLRQLAVVAPEPPSASQEQLQPQQLSPELQQHEHEHEHVQLEAQRTMDF